MGTLCVFQIHEHGTRQTSFYENLIAEIELTYPV